GTVFNVNAYPDEPASKASLLEGSVKINDKVLRPGQAYLDGQIFKTNIQQDVAWKNGVFDFNMVSLQLAMRQLSRWYDVEVVYKDEIPSFNFYGEVQRKLTLSQVLNGLSDLGVKFQIEGKTLIVSKDPKSR
ncbi:MAG TPA: DUF4974 domain-containing protein, partial [Flavitalea sp.]|nr:DUF4974 domain-containing protein [Flavitalea sp.]